MAVVQYVPELVKEERLESQATLLQAGKEIKRQSL
jgi:hypothetical protein